MIIYGMGELHLEIIKDRLLREYNLEVYLGEMLVAYREQIEASSEIVEHTLKRYRISQQVQYQCGHRLPVRVRYMFRLDSLNFMATGFDF